MAKTKKTLEELNKKYGISGNTKTTSTKSETGKQDNSSASKLEELNKKYGIGEAKTKPTVMQDYLASKYAENKKIKPQNNPTTKQTTSPVLSNEAQIEALQNELSAKKVKYTDEYWQSVHDEAVSRFRAEGKWDSVKIENRAWAAVDEQRRAWDKEKEEIEKQIRRLSGVRDATWKDVFINSFERGYQQSRFGDESYDKMMGNENEADAINALLQSDKYQFEADGYFKEGLSGASELIGQMGYMFSKPETAAKVGGTTLAGAGTASIVGKAGPQLALPEEVATVPAGALLGFKAGMGMVSAENALRIEAGHAYNEMIEHGISHDTARNIALAVGTVNAVLEVFQTDELIDAFKVLNKSGATSTVAEKIFQELIDRGVDVATEVGQEVAQEGVTMGGTEVAHRIDKGEGLYTAQDVGERLGDTVKSSALAFGMMNVPATVTNIATANYNTKANQGKIEQQTAIKQPIEEQDTLEKAAMDVVTNRNDTQTAKTKPASEVYAAEVKLPIQEAKALKKPINNRDTSTPLYERLEAQSKNNEPITVEEVKKATGFGDNGAKLVTELANREGTTFSQAEKTVKTAYYAGFAKVKSENVNFETDEQINAFTAGKKDRVIQDFADEERAKNAMVNKKSGFSTENLPSDVTKTQVEIVDKLFKAVGVKGYVTKGLKGNAEINHKTGEVLIDFDFEREIGPADNRQKVSIVFHAAHEAAMHRAREIAPDEMTAFMYEMYKHLAGNEPSTFTLADQKRYAYAEQGVNLSLDGAIEEITANNILYLYYNNESKFSKAIDNIANGTNVKAKQGLTKWIECIKEIIAKISDFLAGKNVKESAEIRAEVAKLRDMFEAGIEKAVENGKKIKAKTDINSTKNLEIKVNEDYNGNISYLMKANGKKSEQYGVMWTLDKGVLDNNEVSAFYEKISETKNNKYQNYHNAADGQLIYEIDDKLIYTDGDYDYPHISKVVAFNTNDNYWLEYGKESFYDGENYGYQTETIIEIVEAVLGEGTVETATYDSYEADKRGGDPRGKRKNGAEVNRRSQKDVEGKSYSLKDEYWHTDLSKAQIKEVEKWLRRKGSPEATKITDTANWYKGRIDGEDLFVIYSDKPTILYERKGVEAKLELDILLERLEDIENGRDIVESKQINTLLSGDRVQAKHNLANNNAGLGERGSNTGYASVLQGESSEFIGSEAFRNVIRNLFEIQEKSISENGEEKHSLKGTVVEGELASLVKKYGAIPKGEKPHRDVQVPKKTEKDKKVSQTVRTILEAKATPDEAVPTIEKMVEDGMFSYDSYTDKQAVNDADSYIKEYGWDESLNDWFDAVEKGEVSKKITAMGWALYNNAANTAATTTSETERTTAIKTSLKILDAMVKHQRSAAQALQATRILKNLSPETQLYGVQKSVQALQNELADKYGDKAPDLKIDEELAEQFLNAKTPEERAEIEKEIYKDIGRQMPSRFIDKWNAWRYLAMLGNARTHIRNIVGNAGFAPVVLAKDLTATAIESVVHRVSGKKTVRGKSIITGNKADRTLLKAAWDDYSNVADLISNGGKYNDSAMANQQIEEGRQIFKFKPLEAARKKNSKLLETEDMWFAKPHYAFALAQYCKANNITAEQIKKGKAIGPARDYAIKEAQKATYRDTNAFSQMVSDWGRSNKNEKNVAKKAFNTVIEGTLPFRKTPANILVRGVEYSPIGLLKGLSYDLYKVSKGEISATEAIDNISAGLTGTGLLALGVLLAAQGIIRGHGEDEEEKEFKELMGHQAYALELPTGQSITLDWLAPEALPFFVGVNIWETTKGKDNEVNFSSILQAISGITEPMLEMSCLQSLNDLFEGIGYASSNDTSGLVSVLSSAATSYLTQGIPTLFGQAERTGEENRMTTYTEKNSFLTGDMQYTLGRASAKIPIWDYNQIPYIDAWGRKEASGTALKRGLSNFLNPAYTSTIETSNTEKELLRLYEKTGEDGVFPSRADKYFTVDGVRKDLTADEYVRYATLKGEKSYKLVSNLVKSKAYKKLSDAEKVKAVKEAYDYANQKAKQAISNYKPETWVSKADEFGSDVGNYISFKTEVNGTKEENGGKISKQEVVDIILDMAQNDSETWKMYLSMYDSESDMYAYNKGIHGEDYMDFIASLNKYDKPTKSGKYGTYTQEEVKKAIDNMQGLSRKEKSALYQSVNTGWKNNPY